MIGGNLKLVKLNRVHMNSPGMSRNIYTEFSDRLNDVTGRVFLRNDSQTTSPIEPGSLRENCSP